MKSRLGDFPGLSRVRAAARSSGLKGSAILCPSGVGTFRRLDSSLMSLVDSRPRSRVPYSLRFATRRRAQREELPELPVSFLMVPYALRLEFKQSMELTASFHHSCFCSSWERRDESTLSESVPTEARM